MPGPSGDFRYLTSSLGSTCSHESGTHLVLFRLLSKVGILGVISIQTDPFVQNDSLPESFEMELLATPKIRKAAAYTSKEVDHGQHNSN